VSSYALVAMRSRGSRRLTASPHRLSQNGPRTWLDMPTVRASPPGFGIGRLLRFNSRCTPQSVHTTCSKRKKRQPSRPAQTTVSTKPNATSAAGHCLINFRFSFGWPSIDMRARACAVCRLPNKVLAPRCRQAKGAVKQQFNKPLKSKEVRTARLLAPSSG
jgi:hypothetical protein